MGSSMGYHTDGIDLQSSFAVQPCGGSLPCNLETVEQPAENILSNAFKKPQRVDIATMLQHGNGKEQKFDESRIALARSSEDNIQDETVEREATGNKKRRRGSDTSVTSHESISGCKKRRRGSDTSVTGQKTISDYMRNNLET